MQQIKGMMNTLSSASNPQLMLNQMLMSNPQLAKAFNLIRSMGGDSKTTFYNFANQMGVNPDQFINKFKQGLS